MKKLLSIILTLLLLITLIGCNKPADKKNDNNNNSSAPISAQNQAEQPQKVTKTQVETGTYVCEYEDYIFYRNTNDNGSLYRYNVKDDSYIKLFDENAYPFLHSIKVFDEQVYFVTHTETDTSPTLYRVSIDGEKTERLIENVCDDFCVTEEAIYYTGYQCPNHNYADYQLHKYTFADKKTDILLDERCYQQFNLIDNKIYCLVTNDDGSKYGLAYFDIATQATVSLDTGKADNFQCAVSSCGGEIIYLNMNEMLYSYNTKTQEFKEIKNTYGAIAFMCAASDDLLYFKPWLRVNPENKVYQYKNGVISEYEDRDFEENDILQVIDNKPIMVKSSNTNGNKIEGDNRLNVVEKENIEEVQSNTKTTTEQQPVQSEVVKVEAEQLALSAEDKAVKEEIAKFVETDVDFRNEKLETIQQKEIKVAFSHVEKAAEKQRVFYKNSLGDEFVYSADDGKLFFARIESAVVSKSEDSIDLKTAQKTAETYVSKEVDITKLSLTRSKEVSEGYLFVYSKLVSNYKTNASFEIIVGFDNTINYIRNNVDAIDEIEINIDEEWIEQKKQECLSKNENSKIEYVSIMIENNKPYLEIGVDGVEYVFEIE